MSEDESGSTLSHAVGWSLAVIDAPEVDEFDLDLQLGELTSFGSHRWLGMPFAAQTDTPCPLPTGGRGAGTTCNTQDNTCVATCAGLNTCPHTQCGNTCGNTCGHTCADTCVATCEDTCGNTCRCISDLVNGLGRMVCKDQ